MTRLADFLHSVYDSYHHPEFIHPDPLEVVLSYTEPADREIAALVCSSLALGRVSSICAACRDLLGRFSRPSEIVVLDSETIGSRIEGFVYRFFSTEDVAFFLVAVSRLVREFGSVDEAIAVGAGSARETDTRVTAGLRFVVSRLRAEEGKPANIIVSDPDRGSAAKRLHLFLRWMVRRDAIDPGGFSSLEPSELTVPLDVHMHRIAMRLGLTQRRSADLKAANEITERFRRICPEDPVRFDFSLTRLGIHPDAALGLLGKFASK